MLSPDLEAADVTIEIPYQIQNQGRSETIRLQQIYHYEFRNEWRWMEPDSVYWGSAGQEVYEGKANSEIFANLEMYDGNAITALYPLRDEEIIQRVVDDLPNYFGGLCREIATVNCRWATEFMIYFEREPGIWGDLVARTEENGSYIPRFSSSSIRRGMITLPTPSLVGIPVDEAGYQALLRGYASHVLSAVLAQIYEDDCCPDDLTFPLFLETEMAKRGLGLWPPPILNKEIAAQADADLMPDKDIALLCTTAERESLQLYRDDLAGGQLRAELSGRNIVRIRAAPNGQGIIAQEIENVSETEVLTRIIYWHNNTARILYEETLPETVFAASTWQVHEDEQRLLIVVPDLDSRVTTFVQVDLTDCASGNCPKSIREMIGAPTWSPDGSQFLVKSGNILWWRQFVGDKVEQDPLGLGTAPFWLNEDTFGYVRTRENRLQEIVTASPGDEEMTVVLDSERMRLILMAENRPQQLMIGYIGVEAVPAPMDVTHWTILAFEWFPNGELGQAYIFSYSPEVDALWLKLQSDQLHSFNLAPNGRWLAASLYDDDLESWRIKVEAIVAGQDMTLLPWQATEEAEPPRYDWTADSQWLLVLHQGVLTLYSPQSDTTQLAPPPLPGCVQAAWMN